MNECDFGKIIGYGAVEAPCKIIHLYPQHLATVGGFTLKAFGANKLVNMQVNNSFARAGFVLINNMFGFNIFRFGNYRLRNFIFNRRCIYLKEPLHFSKNDKTGNPKCFRKIR
jgi:hypothetical protein